MKVFKILFLAISLFSCMGLSAKPTASDTLRIVRDDEFLRYPFGVLESFKAFKAHYSGVLNIKSADVKPDQGGGMEHTKTFTVSANYARFYADKNTKRLETVSALVLNKEMPLQNGIMIGTERTDFLKKMKISADGDKTATVLELSSKSGDIHHFYHFQNDRVVRIMITSELAYQKE